MSEKKTNKLRFALSRLSYRKDIIIAILFIIIFSFLIIVPLLEVVITSFTYQSYDLRVVKGAEEGAFTFYHYIRVFASEMSSSIFYKPLLNSLMVGAGVTVLAMFLGSIFAWLIVRTNIPYKRFLESVMVIPYMMPSWVLALAWLMIFQNDRVGGSIGIFTYFTGIMMPNWFSYGLFPIIICLALHYYAYSFLLMSGALRTVDSQLEEAGSVAGLSKLQVLRKITFPLVLPALGSSFVLTFTRSMGTFGTPALLGLPVRFFNLPTQIYASINTRNIGDGFLLAFVLVVLSGAAILINSKIIGVRKNFVTMSGKGFRSKPDLLGRSKPLITTLMIVFVFLVIILPVLVLAWSSLTKTPGDYSFSNLTTHFWIGESDPNFASGEPGILRNDGILSGIWNSIRLGVFAALINAFVGILVGYAVVRNRGSKLSGTLEAVSFTPYVFPSIALGAIYLGMFANSVGPIPALYGTFTLLVLIVVVKNMPFSTRSGISAILQIDTSLEETAMMQGVPWLKRLRKIIFPLSKSGFLSGMILTFITAMRELSLLILLVTPGNRVLTTIIFSYEDQEQVQHANGVTLILLLIIIAAIIVVRRFVGSNSVLGSNNN